MTECQCDPDVWGPDGLERGTGHNPVCPNYRGPSTMSNLDELLGKLLGRHHREMVVSREHCVACNQFSPTFDEVRTAARRAEALEKALRAIVTEADIYRKDETTPECWQDSGPYCGTHSFLEVSPLIDAARATLAGEGAPR